MIPTAHVELTPELPATATFWAPNPSDIGDEGFGFFRDVWDIVKVDPRAAAEMIAVEASIADVVADLAHNDEEFDLLARAIEDGDASDERLQPSHHSALKSLVAEGDDQMPPLDGLELGVAGLVYALSAVGCFPAASCRGHPGAHAWSRAPVVLFAGHRQQCEVLTPLVGLSQCGFDIDPARPDLLIVSAASIVEMMQLAVAVLQHLPRFDALPAPQETPGTEGGELF